MLTETMYSRQNFSSGSLLLLLLLNACASTEEKRRDISLEEPRISKGVLLETRADWSARWQEMVAEKEAQTEAASAAPSITSDRPGEDAAEPAAPVETLTPPASWPPGAGQIIDLPRLNRQELAEFLNALVRRLQAGQGYTVATPAAARDLPELPDGFDDERVLVRETETGLRALRIGYWRYQSQLPQLAFYGVVIQDEGLRRSGDLAAVESAIETMRFSREEMRGNLTADRLDSRVIQLNYIDVPSAMNAMKGLGLTIFPTGTDLPEEVVFDSLPFVVELPGPQAESAGLVGGGSVVVGEMGSSTIPSLASALAQNTVASEKQRHRQRTSPSSFSSTTVSSKIVAASLPPSDGPFDVKGHRLKMSKVMAHATSERVLRPLPPTERFWATFAEFADQFISL